MKKILTIGMVFFLFVNANCQKGIIFGQIVDEETRTPLAFSSISIDDDTTIHYTDSLGKYSINVDPGYHSLSVNYLSYETAIVHEIKVDPVKPNQINISLKTSSNTIKDIVINGSGLYRNTETPLSIQTIGINEINRLPGTTLDVSRVIKNLPGVLPKVSFGYNIIVRGGASHENKFFIDGIEIPSINHFSVQGVSGGPNGLINVDLLRSAGLITGAFPANRGNALSSVLNLNTRAGRSDRLGGKFTLGATDVGLTVEGPVSKNANFIFSARKSFSEYYLKVFKLPILPAYSDYNFKFESKWKRNEIRVIAIGGFDKSRLNLDDAENPDASTALRYNTGYIPEGDQSVNTIGINYKKYSDFGYSNIIASSSLLRNKAVKYFDNTYEAEDLWLDYDSQEFSKELRFEQHLYLGEGNLKFGLSMEQEEFKIDNYSLEIGPDINPLVNDYDSELNTISYGAFISSSRDFLNEKLSIFGGLRIDASTYGMLTRNPLDQLSPRFSLSYKLNPKTTLSLNMGSYYQLPPAVILGFSGDTELSNKDRLGYINSSQFALGYRKQISENKTFSVEAFYKLYNDYPFLLRDSISFANANADYVVVGNQAASSTSEGRAYGIEFFAQKRFSGKNLWSAAYNYSKSEFKSKDGNYVSSSWDTRHFLNMVYARTFGKNWQIGAKFTYASSSPYTPFNTEQSSQIAFWELNRQGVFDYENLNSAYLKPFHQLDLRFDKNFYGKKFTTNLYIDIQNIYSSAVEFIPYLVPISGEDGSFLVDPNDPTRYQTEIITSDSGRVLPTIGIIIEL